MEPPGRRVKDVSRVQRIVVVVTVVAAVICFGFGFIPFSVEVRVELPFLKVGTEVECGPPFLEWLGDDEPCTEEARERAGAAMGISLAVLVAGGLGVFLLGRLSPPGGGEGASP
jgi:hypothetical protein